MLLSKKNYAAGSVRYRLPNTNFYVKNMQLVESEMKRTVLPCKNQGSLHTLTHSVKLVKCHNLVYECTFDCCRNPVWYHIFVTPPFGVPSGFIVFYSIADK